MEQHDSSQSSTMRARMRAKLWRRPWRYALLGLMCCLGTWPRRASGQSVDVAGTVIGTVGHQIVLSEATQMHMHGGGLAWNMPGAEGPMWWCPAGFSQDQQGLLTIKRAITNWDAYYRRSQCTGWTEQPGADVCTWTSVGCRNGNVVLVRLANNGFQHHGARAAAPAEAAAPLHMPGARMRPAPCNTCRG